MSPEQVEANPVDHRSDLYSLGLILYEMVTADLPFESDSVMQAMYQRVTQNPKSPKARESGTSGLSGEHHHALSGKESGSALPACPGHSGGPRARRFGAGRVDCAGIARRRCSALEEDKQFGPLRQ